MRNTDSPETITSKSSATQGHARRAVSDGLRDISALVPRVRNPRTHSKKQIAQIAESIRRFGFLSPVLVDAESHIIAGHGRVEGAKLAGLTQVPVMRVDHLSDAEIRAYVIADNKLAENAGWDLELLTLELQELALEVDLDLTVMGFETAEIDVLLAPAAEPESETSLPPIDRAQAAVSRSGDLWQVGRHRVLCGSALDADAYALLLGKERARCVFMDPPYNVPIDGHVSGKGQHRHPEFVMASGEMSSTDFTHFLRVAFDYATAFSLDGSLHFICMDWRHMSEVLEAGRSAYTELKNLCVWTKTNAGMGSLYRSQHELVFLYKHGLVPHVNNVELGRHGRNRTNVWSYAGMNAFGRDRDADLAAHPTVKPVAMVSDAILDTSQRGDIVLDPFLGSGTTILAAEQTGRVGMGLELDPYYVDLIVQRLSAACGLTATLLETGESFAEVVARRQHQA